LAIDEEAAELDEFDGEAIKNQAHKVIYKSVALKLADFRKRRKQFLDESRSALLRGVRELSHLTLAARRSRVSFRVALSGCASRRELRLGHAAFIADASLRGQCSALLENVRPRARVSHR